MVTISIAILAPGWSQPGHIHHIPPWFRQRSASFCSSALRRGFTQRITGISPPSSPPTQPTHSSRRTWTREKLSLERNIFFGPWLSLKLQTCHCSMAAMLVFFVLSPMLIMLPSVDPKKYPNGRQAWLHLQHSHSIPVILSCGISSAYFNNIHTSFYHVLSISVYR